MASLIMKNINAVSMAVVLMVLAAMAGHGCHAGSTTRTCPVDIVKLSVCSPLLSGSVAPGCCPLLGLLGVDLDLCLCLAVDVNVLGLVTVDLPKLDVVAKIATSCGYTLPPNFTCP